MALLNVHTAVMYNASAITWRCTRGPLVLWAQQQEKHACMRWQPLAGAGSSMPSVCSHVRACRLAALASDMCC